MVLHSLLFRLALFFRLLIAPIVIAPIVIALLVASCASSEPVDETKNWSVEKLFEAANEAMKEEECVRALSLYDKVQTRYPFGPYAQQSLLESIHCHRMSLDGDVMVLATAESFIKQYPNHPALDYVYYVYGLTLFEEDYGFWAWMAQSNAAQQDPKATLDAYQAFRTLVTKFPDSPYAPEARARMDRFLEILASYEVQVAQLYFDHGAYVAAAGRITSALQKYPESPSTQTSLVVLARSYQALELYDLLDNTVTVLKSKNPEHPFLLNYQSWRQQNASKFEAVKKTSLPSLTTSSNKISSATTSSQ